MSLEAITGNNGTSTSRTLFLGRGMISPEDLSLYRVTDSAEEAMDEIVRFYRVYHSMRYVGGNLVLHLQHPPTPPLLDRIRGEFADILEGGTFEVTGALPEEANDPLFISLPRLRFRFDRRSLGRLRQLIDLINGEG